MFLHVFIASENVNWIYSFYVHCWKVFLFSYQHTLKMNVSCACLMTKAAPTDIVSWSMHWNYVLRFWNKPCRNTGCTKLYEKCLDSLNVNIPHVTRPVFQLDLFVKMATSHNIISMPWPDTRSREKRSRTLFLKMNDLILYQQYTQYISYNSHVSGFLSPNVR